MACRLFQEWCCVQCAKVENQTLFYVRTHQKDVRAELFQNLTDAIAAHDAENSTETLNVGRRIVCPSSVTGSPRNMHQRFLDSTAVVRVFGDPSFFITFTCNPNWLEIVTELLPNQKPSDRPDIIARVFKLKKDALMKEIVKDDIFGSVVAFMQVVEFQKRGLPHAHILLIMHQRSKVWTSDDVDKIVSAELPPDPSSFPVGSERRRQATELEQLVLLNHRHGPCGVEKPNAPCMFDKNGNQTIFCQKGFPKEFQTETEWNDNEYYPKYRRRSPENGGRSLVTPTGIVDNRWIVPYSPYLLAR